MIEKGDFTIEDADELIKLLDQKRKDDEMLNEECEGKMDRFLEKKKNRPGAAISKEEVAKHCCADGTAKQCRFFDNNGDGTFTCWKHNLLERETIQQGVRDFINDCTAKKIDPYTQNAPLGNNCPGPLSPLFEVYKPMTPTPLTEATIKAKEVKAELPVRPGIFKKAYSAIYEFVCVTLIVSFIPAFFFALHYGPDYYISIQQANHQTCENTKLLIETCPELVPLAKELMYDGILTNGDAQQIREAHEKLVIENDNGLIKKALYKE